jgi:hypothetical protein
MSGSNVRRWQPNPNLIVLAGYFLLTAVMTWPLVRNLTTAIPGDSFDGWQNYWNQWWIKVALVDRQQNPFFTDILYYPTGVGLYFHTLNPFNGLTTLPIQLAAGLIPAYNAVVFLSWTLGGYGVYLLARWVLRASAAIRHAHLPAFLAGLIFTFSPFHMAHLLGHMQVMALQWIPFYTLYLLRALHQQRQGRSWLRSALLAGLFLTLTGLCDWYFVLYLFFFTGLVLLAHWGRAIWQRRAQNGDRNTAPTFSGLRSLIPPLLPPLVAGALFLLLLAPLLVPMVREAIQFRFMVRPATDLYILSASVMDFLIPNRLHTLFRPDSLTWPGNQIAPVSERTIGIGYVALGLALVAAWRDRRRAAFWLVGAFCFVLLALGPRLHLGNITAAEIPETQVVLERWTPYALLNQLVPFMRISRSVSRHALMVQLCIAIAAAIGLASLGARSSQSDKGTPMSPKNVGPGWWRSFGILACLIVLGESWVAPYPLSPPDTPAFYEQVRTMPEAGAVLNLPMNYDRPGYLLYQTVHQKPLAVAYISRDDPRTLTERMPVLQHFRHLGPDILAGDPAAVAPTVLHELGVGIVVLDRYKMPGGLEREYTESLAAAIFADQPPLFADDRITAYRVQPPDQPVPYLSLGPLHWGALQSKEGERPCRAIGEQPAQVELHHVPPAATLRIAYRTAPEQAVAVHTLDGTTLATLPAAPEGNQTAVELGNWTTIALSTAGVDGACIEALELGS